MTRKEFLLSVAAAALPAHLRGGEEPGGDRALTHKLFTTLQTRAESASK